MDEHECKREIERRDEYLSGADARIADLEVALSLVSGALVDASDIPVPVDVMKYGEAVRALDGKRREAEAEVERLRAQVRRWGDKEVSRASTCWDHEREAVAETIERCAQVADTGGPTRCVHCARATPPTEGNPAHPIETIGPIDQPIDVAATEGKAPEPHAWNINITCPRCGHVGDVEASFPCCEHLDAERARSAAMEGEADKYDAEAERLVGENAALEKRAEAAESRSAALLEALRLAAPFTGVEVARGPAVKGWDEMRAKVFAAIAAVGAK